MLKGTLFHEVIHLPSFWYRIAKVGTKELEVEKIKFGKQRRQYYLKVRGEKSDPKKLVVYFHGGGWLFGTPKQFLQNAQVFTDFGYTVYMPSYRRLPYYTMQDIKADLLATVKNIAADLTPNNVDSILMSGMSAGGHLAALLALDPTISWSEKYQLPKPNKYIGIGAPLDLSRMYTPVVRRLAGNKNSPQFHHYNPQSFLEVQQQLDLFILSAGRDGLVPYRAKRGFIEAAKTLKLNIQHDHYPRATHLELAHWSIPESKYHKIITGYLKKIAVLGEKAGSKI